MHTTRKGTEMQKGKPKADDSSKQGTNGIKWGDVDGAIYRQTKYIN